MIKNMVEKLIEKSDIEEYWRLGGMLNKCGFEKTKCILSEYVDGERFAVNDSSLAQIRHMAEFSEIVITLKQQYLYKILREMSGWVEGKSDLSLKTPGVSVWTLTDQQLMAEVIRLTDEESLPKFMDAYPNIFLE